MSSFLPEGDDTKFFLVLLVFGTVGYLQGQVDRLRAFLRRAR